MVPENEIKNVVILPVVETPQCYQISRHINNLRAYFHEEYPGRHSFEQGVTANTRQILDTFYFLFENQWQIEQWLEMRHFYPLEFRVAQIIQAYGEEVLTGYFELIYGKEDVA